MKTHKWIVAPIMLVMALAAVGVVSAQPGRPGDGPRTGRGGFMQGHPAARINVNLVELTAHEIGMELQEIATQLRDGQTLADIIESSGSNVDDVSAVVLTEAEATVQELFDNGDLSEEYAANLLGNVESRWDILLNHEFGGGLRDRAMGQLRLNVGEAIVEATGLELAVIQGQMQDGMTLAEIIEANDGSVDEVVATVVARLTADIEAAVAKGNLTQDWADQLLENLEQHVTDAINGELGARFGRFGDFGRGRGGRGFGGFLGAQGTTSTMGDA